LELYVKIEKMFTDLREEGTIWGGMPIEGVIAVKGVKIRDLVVAGG